MKAYQIKNVLNIWRVYLLYRCITKAIYLLQEFIWEIILKVTNFQIPAAIVHLVIEILQSNALENYKMNQLCQYMLVILEILSMTIIKSLDLTVKKWSNDLLGSDISFKENFIKTLKASIYHF